MERTNDIKEIANILREDYGHQTELWTEDNFDDISDIIKAVKQHLINTPQTENFIDGVSSEMAHHLERWGDEKNKYPHDFEMAITYLNGKLTKAIWDKNLEKVNHHLVTIAAVCGTAFKYIKEEESNSKKWFNKE